MIHASSMEFLVYGGCKYLCNYFLRVQMQVCSLCLTCSKRLSYLDRSFTFFQTKSGVVGLVGVDGLAGVDGWLGWMGWVTYFM